MWSRSLAALAVLCTASAAQAQSGPGDRAAAEVLFLEGQRLLGADNAAEACPKFEESQRLDPALGTKFNLADCYVRIGRTASAWMLYREVAAEAKNAGQADRADFARAEADKLFGVLSKITIEVAAESAALSGVEVRRDGGLVGRGQWKVPVPVDLGEHTIAATAPGYAPFEKKVDVSERGASVTVTVPHLAPEPSGAPAPAAAPVAAPAQAAPTSAAPPPEEDTGEGSSMRTLGFVSLGLGGAGLVLGGVMGVMALGQKSDLESACVDGRCPSSQQEDIDSYDQSRLLSTIGLAVGVVGAAAGVTLLLTAPSESADSADLQLRMTPSNVAVRGRF